MCDFRVPPTGVYDIQSKIGYIVENRGFINGYSYVSGPSGLIRVPGKKMSEINGNKDAGIYYICASGSYYLYYDGEKWWHEYDEYFEKYREDPNRPWVHTHLRYKFLFPEEDHTYK